MYATMLDRRADRGEGVQLGGHHVARFDDLRNPDAVRDRFRVPVYHRRRHRPGVGDYACGYSITGHLLCGGALPLCAGVGLAVRHLRRRVFLVAEVDRPHVRREAGQAAFLAVDHLLQHPVLPDALPGAGRHAAPHPDYALQFADFNALATIGAFGLGLSQLILLVVVLKCIKSGAKAADHTGKAQNRWSGRTCPLRRPTIRS